MEVGGDDCGEGKLGGADAGRGRGGSGGGRLRDAPDVVGDGFFGEEAGGIGGGGGCDDGDVAEEVLLVGGVGDELDALYGEVRGESEFGDGGGGLRGEGAGGGDDGVEGLGFAAGGDGGAEDDGGVELGEGFAVGRAEVEGEVELGEGGFLEGERGGAGEMAIGEVEEGEGAEGVVVGGGDLGGSEEVVRGEVEVDFGVGARGHVEVEGEGVVVEREVADGGGLGVGGLGFAVADDEGDFVGMVAIVEAEDAEVVGGRAGGVGVDVGVEYGAGDAGGVGREGEGAKVAEVLRLGYGGWGVAERGEGAGLEEEGGEEGEGFHAVASRVRELKATGCG